MPIVERTPDWAKQYKRIRRRRNIVKYIAWGVLFIVACWLSWNMGFLGVALGVFLFTIVVV